MTFAQLWVGDITRKGLGQAHADAIYIDPPWNPGIARIMRQWASVDTGPVDYLEFVCRTSLAIAHACPSGPWYIEVGAKPTIWVEALRRVSPLRIHIIPATWGSVRNPKPHNILCANGAEPIPAGLHGEETTMNVMERLASVETILDAFIGKGLTLRHALPRGISVFGMEINQKRLAESQAWVKTAHPEVKLIVEKLEGISVS